VPSGADEIKDIYRKWAPSYEDSFADKWGYVAPIKIANIFLKNFKGAGPILDVGAGTGLVAENLNRMDVDGIDISKEMLAIAKTKNIYRNVIEGDLSKRLEIKDQAYNGIVSCGTFSHGLVGPECLDELLRIVKKESLFCCGTIYSVFDELGFGSTLARLVAERRISSPDFEEIKIYSKNDHSHSKDIGLVVLFKKL
tara:strand:- start:1260 stop:1850 length:591 start_codon:yes stop_codon:yes gene_type:complete